MSQYFISLLNVSKVYPKELGAESHLALDNLSFSIEKGTTLGLVGANGAGKSTCIHLLMNFIRPDIGEIMIAGQSVRCPTLRRSIGYLPEVASFPPNLTVMDMLHFVGSVCGLSRKTILVRGEILLQELGLWSVRKRPLRSYSKGMQQRASFAMALINDPSLLILDEPMSGLDPVGREKIIALIQRLKKQEKTILFCSHILEDVDRLADQLLVLHRGTKIYEGTVQHLCEEQQATELNRAFLSLIQGVTHEQ